MKLKKMSKKIIICLLVFLMLFNFVISPLGKIDIVYAAPPTAEPGSASGTDPDPGSSSTSSSGVQDFENTAEALIETRNNGLSGILSWLIRVIVVGIFSVIQVEEFLIADSAGNDGTVSSIYLTPFDIFFNRFTLTNINIFQTDDLKDESGNLKTDSIVYKIRENVAFWYSIINIIALAFLLVTLIIIGIRMLLANLAEEKARLKSMFVDWLISAALVVFMALLIVGTIIVNNSFVNVIKNIADSVDSSRIMEALISAAFSDSYLLGMGATITYVLMVLQTFVFIVVYIKRFLVVIFLIAISPIVPLSYVTDRAKGGKAVDMWFKEFWSNVFIQVIHCLIYVAIISVPLSFLGTEVSSLESLAGAILSVFSMLFVKKAEELMKHLFGVDKSSILSTFSSVVNNTQNAVLSAVSIANGTYTVTNNVANNTTQFGTNIQTFGQRASNTLHGYRDRLNDYLGGMEESMMDGGRRGRDSSGGKEDNFEDDEWEQLENGGEMPGTESNSDLDENRDGENIIPVLMAPSDEDIEDTIEEAIESTYHEENENNETNTHNIIEENEIIEENSESEIEQEPVVIPMVNEEQQGMYDETKREYQELMDEIKAAVQLQNELNSNLKNLEGKLDEDTAEELQKQIEELFENEGLESAREYANSFGDTAEGEYARSYLEYLDNQKALDEMTNEEDGEVLDLIDDAINNGIINAETGEQLLNNSIRVSNGEEDKTEEIFEEEEETKVVKDEEEIEVVDGEVVDITDDLKLSKATVNSVLNSTRRATIDNAKILEILEGEVLVEGDFSNNNLMDFNVKILEKAKQGAYSQSNFKMAEEKVRREGDIAVRRLEKFKEDQSEANARMLTPAGKEYAQLMIESQQAGMFVVSAGMNERSSLNESKDVSTGTYQKVTPMYTNRTANVVGDLNDRRKRA